MPDSYGKRQRDAVKARKANKREERRQARRERRNDPGADSISGDMEPPAAEEHEDTGSHQPAERSG